MNMRMADGHIPSVLRNLEGLTKSTCSSGILLMSEYFFLFKETSESVHLSIVMASVVKFDPLRVNWVRGSNVGTMRPNTLKNRGNT